MTQDCKGFKPCFLLKKHLRVDFNLVLMSFVQIPGGWRRAQRVAEECNMALRAHIGLKDHYLLDSQTAQKR